MSPNRLVNSNAGQLRDNVSRLGPSNPQKRFSKTYRNTRVNAKSCKGQCISSRLTGNLQTDIINPQVSESKCTDIGTDPLFPLNRNEKVHRATAYYTVYALRSRLSHFLLWIRREIPKRVSCSFRHQNHPRTYRCHTLFLAAR